MEAVSMVVAALVSGAAAKAGDVAGSALIDAYASLKRVIADRYAESRQVTEILEADPNSEAMQAAVAAALEKQRAGDDADLLAKAEKVTEILANTPAEQLGAVGLDLADVKAANVRIKSLNVTDATGMRFRRVDLSGDIEAGDVRVEASRPN